jgi:membrane-associated protease RseP (regulator of RpoE activity)
VTDDRSPLHWTPYEGTDLIEPLPAPPPPAIRRHVGLFLLTAFSTAFASASHQGHDLLNDPASLVHGLPFAAALLGILLVHEAGHYLMCRRHGVDASLPYFLPAPPFFILGTFGAFIRIRSRFPDRRALFDIGAAGPWAGFAVALAVTAFGLARSTVLGTPPEHGILELGDSLLTHWLTHVVLDADPARVVLHPIAFAGWVGLFVTSLNLLPAGQLDGGHVLYAAAGRRMQVLPAVLLAFLLWLGWRGQPVWVFWGGVIAIMMLLGHPPTDHDRAPLGAARTIGTFATLALFVLTFVPEPLRFVP